MKISACWSVVEMGTILISLLNVMAEEMVFNANMFGAWSEARASGKGKDQMIIFEDFRIRPT